MGYVDEEMRRGYADQMAWLAGRSVPEAHQALTEREHTLGIDPYNIGGNRATRDYIRQLETYGEPADNCEGQAAEDDAHERAHEAGSATLIPRADCPECRRDAGLLPLDCEDGTDESEA